MVSNKRQTYRCFARHTGRDTGVLCAISTEILRAVDPETELSIIHTIGSATVMSLPVFNLFNIETRVPNFVWRRTIWTICCSLPTGHAFRNKDFGSEKLIELLRRKQRTDRQLAQDPLEMFLPCSLMSDFPDKPTQNHVKQRDIG